MGFFGNGKMDKISDALVATAKIAGDAYKAGIQAQTSGKLLELVLDRIVDPNLAIPVMQMGMVAGQGFLQSTVYDMQAAAGPAHHVLRAASDIQRMSGAVRTWAFAPPHMRLLDRFHSRIFWMRQRLEITEQIQRLANILWAAAGECDLAGSQVLQKYNPLSAVISPAVQPASPPDIQHADCPIPMPPNSYRRDKDQVISVRLRVGILADYLYSMAERCIGNIEASSLDHGREFSPNVVRAEGALVVQRTVEALAACSALARLANQPLAIPEKRVKRQNRTGTLRELPQTAQPRRDGQDLPPAPAA